MGEGGFLNEEHAGRISICKGTEVASRGTQKQRWNPVREGECGA